MEPRTFDGQSVGPGVAYGRVFKSQDGLLSPIIATAYVMKKYNMPAK